MQCKSLTQGIVGELVVGYITDDSNSLGVQQIYWLNLLYIFKYMSSIHHPSVDRQILPVQLLFRWMNRSQVLPPTPPSSICLFPVTILNSFSLRNLLKIEQVIVLVDI